MMNRHFFRFLALLFFFAQSTGVFGQQGAPSGNMTCGGTSVNTPYPPPGGSTHVHNPVAECRGTVYLDQNGNGVRDGNESAFPQPAVVTEDNQQVGFSSQLSNGQFVAQLDMGPYTLWLHQPPAHYVVTQPASGAHSGQLSSVGQTVYNADFGIAPIPNQPDIRLVITPLELVRAGFLTRYRATLTNVGTTVVDSGTVSLTLASNAVYVASTPGAQVSGQQLTWTFSNLAPFAARDFDVQFSLPINTAVGTGLYTSGFATMATTADVVPADNYATATQQVMSGGTGASYIEVNHSQLTLGQLASGQALDYTIYFQNLGNATVSSVMIVDTLNSALFNLSTVSYVAATHAHVWSLHGKVLKVTFNNINLPPRSQDALHSQGFIRFRMQLNAALTQGTVIPNQAHVTFGSNPPLSTNTATTLITNSGAMGLTHDAANAGGSLYPNPAAAQVTLRAELPTAGPVALTLRDALGRVVLTRQWSAAAGQLDAPISVQHLPAGVYVAQIQTPDGALQTLRWVRE